MLNTHVYINKMYGEAPCISTSTRRYCDLSCLLVGSFLCSWIREHIARLGAAARSTSQRCGRRSGNMFANIYIEKRAHCTASIQAAAKDVSEKYLKKICCWLCGRLAGVCGLRAHSLVGSQTIKIPCIGFNVSCPLVNSGTLPLALSGACLFKK